MNHSESDKKQIGYLLERTTRVVKLRFHKLFKERGIELTPEQWVIMDSLYQRNDQPQRDLAESSFKDAPSISRILDTLDKKGWIQRTPSSRDRRIYLIHQTPAGRSIVEELHPHVEALRSEGWEGLNEADYQQFTRIINQVFLNYAK